MALSAFLERRKQVQEISLRIKIFCRHLRMFSDLHFLPSLVPPRGFEPLTLTLRASYSDQTELRRHAAIHSAKATLQFLRFPRRFLFHHLHYTPRGTSRQGLLSIYSRQRVAARLQPS